VNFGAIKKKRNLRFTVMKLKLLHIFYPLALTVIFTACSKGGTPAEEDDGGPHVITPTDVTAPVIEILTPATDQVFSNGNTISITGKLTDDYGLYRGSIRITNDANGSVMKEQLYEIHGLVVYNYNISYSPAVAASSNYTITVSFEDHGLNTATKSVKIKVNP
jgi:phosphate-selective porin